MSPNRAGLGSCEDRVTKSTGGFDIELPRSLRAERRGDIAVLFLARPEKRNAIDDPTVFGIETFCAALPDGIGGVVRGGGGELSGGGHDPTDLPPRDTAQVIPLPRSGPRAFEGMESGKAPVGAVLHGGGGGGGLKTPPPCHVRV